MERNTEDLQNSFFQDPVLQCLGEHGFRVFCAYLQESGRNESEPATDADKKAIQALAQIVSAPAITCANACASKTRLAVRDLFPKRVIPERERFGKGAMKHPRVIDMSRYFGDGCIEDLLALRDGMTPIPREPVANVVVMKRRVQF